LLSWVVPVVLFVALWLFVMRRMMGNNGIGGGFMSIGKSKAKIYMEDDVSVTFASRPSAGSLFASKSTSAVHHLHR
jgi:cell division protease FtsH